MCSISTVNTTLGGTSPRYILSAMLSLNSVTSIIVALNGMGEAIEAIAQALPTTFATDFPHLPVAVSIANKCHPLMLQTYKPVLTTGDGDCMYHALSSVVCGSGQLSKLFGLLTAYSVVKYRDVRIRALQDAFPLVT